jgi:hypothetical protein
MPWSEKRTYWMLPWMRLITTAAWITGFWTSTNSVWNGQVTHPKNIEAPRHLQLRSVRVTFPVDSRSPKLYEIMIDWLIIYGFTSRWRIIHSYGEVTIAGEGLQNLGICSAFRAFEHGGIFIVPHLLWHGTSVFPVSSKGPPHSVASYDTQGDVEDLF